MSVNSILGNLLKSPSTSTGNTSWYMGSTKQSKAPSYVTVLKAPSSSESSAAGKATAAKLGVDVKNPKASNKKKLHHSFFDTVLHGAEDVGGNLITDVISTAENTPAGLLKLATTNPVDSAKLIAQDYGRRYGKLFHGDFGGFAHDVGQHPLGYLLDASSLGTGSGALLGKLAPSLAKAGEVSLRLDRTASDVANVTRPTATNVFTRNVLEKPAYSLQKVLPGKLPIFGETSAAKRTLSNRVESEAAMASSGIPAFERAVNQARKQPNHVGQAIDELNRQLNRAPGGRFSKFDPIENFNIMESKAITPEVDNLVKQMKSEIQVAADASLVASEHASPATIAFIKLHNAKENLNQVWEQGNRMKVSKSGKGFLDGIKPVDIHSDPVRNYMDTHQLASQKVSNLISKNFIQAYTKDPQMVKELTQMYEKKGPAGSLGGSLDRSTQLWKDVILAGRPAFIINNYVGNQIMYHLKNGVAGKALQMAADGKLNKAFDTHFHEHGQTLGSAEKALGNSRYRKTVNRVYNLQSKHEQILRKATMREAAMSIPAIKTEVRVLTGKGMSEGDALASAMRNAFKTTDGNTYKSMISKSIDDTMGNYRHFNSSEQLLKKAVPFYSWNRHALRTYSSILKDQPLTANALANLGVSGGKENEKNFPGTPDFMQTYVKGKLGTFDTQSLNPLKGGSDTVKVIKELIAGKSGNLPTVASNLNPLLVGGIQSITGVNATTGAPVNTTGGLIGGVAEQTIGGLPQIKMVNNALGMDTGGNRKDPHYFLTPTGQLKRKFVDSEGKVKFGPDGLPLEAGDRHMIDPSLENSVLGWLGVPKKNINIKTAQIVKKSIDSKNNPPSEFHARKTKAKVKATVNLTTKKHKSKTGFINIQP